MVKIYAEREWLNFQLKFRIFILVFTGRGKNPVTKDSNGRIVELSTQSEASMQRETNNIVAEDNNTGMPQPVTKNIIRDITNSIHDSLHEEIVVCGICDQLCRLSHTSLLAERNFPEAMFELLKAPIKPSNWAPPLHPLLVRQYDVSSVFEDTKNFLNLLISLQGVSKHKIQCPGDDFDCECKPRLFICTTEASNCLGRLKQKKMPKYSIANGNWVGQLPNEIATMTYGTRTRSLLRPVRNFARITSYTGYGKQLKGHMYSVNLKTPVVMEKIPIRPRLTQV